MKSSVETLSPTRVKLAVEVPFDELKSSLDEAYRAIGSQVRVPGFRPGKVPARIIDQRVGRSAVLEEAINKALPKAYSDAVRETGVKALGQPDIEVTTLEDNDHIAFTAEVDVRPDITVPAYDNLAVTVEDAVVTDDELTEQLDELRARFGTLNSVDRPVQTGDFVSIDLNATVDGEPVEGGSAQGLSYEVGSGNLIEGLDDAILGKSAGDTAEFASQLAFGDHAGSDAQINVVVNSVKERELPEVDDEFAQLASEFDTVDELKADLRTRLDRVKVLGQGAEARDKVLELLVEQTEVPLPESSVQAEIEWREHDVVHQLGHDDAAFENYLQTEGKTKDEFTAELREVAEKSVKTQFVLDSIADAEAVSVSDAELTEYIVRQAQRYDMAPQEFADQIVQAGNIGALVADVRRNKALATVLEAANVTDQSGNEVDLSALATPEGQAELEQLDDAVADLDDIEGSDDADESASTDQVASTDQAASRDSE
ncbi:trigger factor [Jatrophihabitans lederbergiae]|uniref:Trigger factor n=1 Tax=Jatrophihabitans lederbergiae TaxID=3075547 RepID=A0ABU2J665_9ACTN|nr:trigger factor [Jatrophihabitans sp. DSM 44399]MDT0260482.1 trigger factor [Jatrophihabitans sp. DSM 44399]